jgi:hypothetical protein
MYGKCLCNISTDKKTGTHHMAEMTKRLYMAAPTTVPGPSSSAGMPRVLTEPVTASIISGAEVPNAMRVRPGRGGDVYSTQCS